MHIELRIGKVAQRNKRIDDHNGQPAGAEDMRQQITSEPAEREQTRRHRQHLQLHAFRHGKHQLGIAVLNPRQCRD